MLINFLFIAAIIVWLGTFLVMVFTSDCVPLFIRLFFLLFGLFLAGNAITVLMGL